MIRKISAILMLLISITCIGQNAPQAFNYQAVIRSSNGMPLANQNVSIRISIMDNSPSGTLLYNEQHNTTTNSFGLVNLTIGQGQIFSGNFSNIAWSSGAKWLTMSVDELQNGSFVETGSFQLLSVPYALYASTSGTSISGGAAISCSSNNYNYSVRGDGNGNWVCEDILKLSSSNIGINTDPSSSFTLKVNGNIGLGFSPSSSYDFSVDGNAQIKEYLGIGSSTSSSYNLDIDGDVRVQDGLGVGTSPPYSGLYVGSSSNFYVKTSLSSGTGVPLVISSGEVKLQSSSIRFKENIKPLKFNKEAVFKIEPVSFNYKKELGGDGSSDIGLIAEDLEKVLPELVIYQYDKNSNPVVSGVKYDRLTLYLLQVIKEQDARIEALEKAIQNKEK